MQADIYNSYYNCETLVIVRKVESENRLLAMRYLRKHNFSIQDSKRLLDGNMPFILFPEIIYDFIDSCDHIEGLSLGFKFYFTSNFKTNIEEWINTLPDDEKEDVFYSLNFYKDIFAIYWQK